ncbi:MAG: LapA family protein [Alphaproteobacteria bacterium]|nr:LapA family protein [Alphaproteobacteria bacterium]
MALLRWILALPLIVGAVLFALAHPTPVPVTWNPFEPAIDLPLYFVALSFFGVGFILGAFISWLGMGKVRKERRQQRKQIKKLEKDIHAANEKMMETLSKHGTRTSLPNTDQDSDEAA